MKQLLLTLAIVLSCLGAAAQPILCGHRGSGYGLENSEESFKKGIELGYKYLETDVKFCKDGVLVCSHDDNTTRLGGTKTLATSTLEELQSETLTQTRSGVTYTGRICSMKEYLDICRDGGVGALIELKWTDGINSNDCSKIPLLIKAIEAEGMRDRCIILTSMKPCLEYIRTNYPDIELQFLTGEFWANHFDWCVKWGIDADIQAGYFDKSTVTKYHDKGLKVNMWTTNDAAGYRNYGNMGCDFITTDRLDSSSLPELDPALNCPPNTVDYPSTDFNPDVHSRYEIDFEHIDAWPEVLAGKTLQRAVRAASDWYLLTSDNTLYYIADGAKAPSAISTEYDGNPIAVSDIDITADGYLVGCEAVTPDTSAWHVYLWRKTTSAPELIIAETADAGKLGATLAASGYLNDLKVYTTIQVDEAATNDTRVCGFTVKKGTVARVDNPIAASAPITAIRTTPTSRNHVMVEFADHGVAEYEFNWDGSDAPSSPSMSFAAASLRPAAAGFMRYGAKLYAAIPSSDADNAVTIAVYDVTNGFAKATAVTRAAALGIVGAGDAMMAAMRCSGVHDSRIWFAAPGVGLFTCVFDPDPEVGDPVELNLVLERQWIRSNTTGNAPEHIHGTNAQQGTAVNGYFYVNDCADRLIYIFDSTGCIGSIPGGSGWGCASDDRGNIIVRDDKLTGTVHNFIIYPAGAMPDNYGEPTVVEVAVPYEGQTNFINASGDLLGTDGGHIYLYPNKQTRVNIITMVSGAVTAVAASDELKMTGSAAGYVLPLGDDTENWFYQVRNVGVQHYKGGMSEAPMAGTQSTSAPRRNSTGGMAVIDEGANRIFIHNSGANYKGGFTVRDLTLDKVFTSVEPIGALGYEDGGNYSTFNWLKAERKGFCDYVVYQYCPSNGMAVYRLYDPELNGVDEISVPAVGGIKISGSIATADGADSMEAVDLQGRRILSAAGDCMDLSSLASGVFILKASTGATTKIIR